MEFLLLLLGINIFFFTTPFLLNFKEHSNPFFFTIRNFFSIKHFIYSRKYSDPFRINLEYTALVLIGAIFDIQHIAYQVVLCIIATLTFSMIVYNAIMVYVFGRNPIFRSDIEFAKTGLMLIHKYRFFALAGFILFIILITFLFFGYGNLILNYSIPLYLSIPLLCIFLFLGLYSYQRFPFFTFHYRVIYSSFVHAFRSYQNGNIFNFLFKHNKEYYSKLNIYRNLNFKEKPNVIILCIESYGSIVFKEKFEGVAQRLASRSKQLENKNFKSATCISSPPLFATGSWLSYSSFLYGIKIFNSTQYSILFKSLSQFRVYQSILGVLKKNQYDNYLLAPLKFSYKHLIDWTLTKNLFTYDYIHDSDAIDYDAQSIRYIKFGSSPPDQYSLAKSRRLSQENNTAPYSKFFITLNSHYPYASPLNIADDWKSLNHPESKFKTTEDLNIPMLKKYEHCIEYQIDFVFDHILNHANPSDIFILFGDHQPPLITQQKHGKGTPVHVISQNETFIEEFKNHGFNLGLLPKDYTKTTIKHEGFFSLFMKAFNKAFGENPEIDLPYKPEGVVIK